MKFIIPSTNIEVTIPSEVKREVVDSFLRQKLFEELQKEKIRVDRGYNTYFINDGDLYINMHDSVYYTILNNPNETIITLVNLINSNK